MKVVFEKKPLAAALQHVARVVERRNTYPILANVLLKADGETVTLRATDLDIEITETIAARVVEDGTITVPAQVLSDIVRKYADGAEITLETTTDSTARIASGRSRINLSTLDPDSFPELSMGKPNASFSIAPTDLRTLFDRTSFAMSTEETRYYLCGVYLHPADGNLRGVATDGHRLARMDVALPAGAESLTGVIVPRKTVNELLKLLDGADGAIVVEFTEGKMRAQIGGVTLTSKMIDGTFPDYSRVTPLGNNKVALVPKADLVGALDRVGTMASERGGRAVKFTFGGSALNLTVTSQDHGEANEDIEVSEMEPFEIGFNIRYVLDILSQIQGDVVRLQFNDAGSPSLIRSESADDAALYVAMPMRI